MKHDSFAAMMAEVVAFHDKHALNKNGGEDMVYRVSLMAEELGEISACVTKGKPISALAEECADLLILIMGNAIATDFDLNAAFWQKMNALSQRKSRMIDGRIRVSTFADSVHNLPRPSTPDNKSNNKSDNKPGGNNNNG